MMRLPLAALAIGLTMVVAPVHAINRCVFNGKVVFTDQPCAGEMASPTPDAQMPKKVVGDATNSAYSTAVGAWRGQAQFQATAGGQVVPEAHAVVSMTIEIDPQGKLTGITTDNACRSLRVASPGVVPTIANLDVIFPVAAIQGSTAGCRARWRSTRRKNMPNSP